MGKPNAGNAALSYPEYIGVGRAPGEVKHLSSQRNRKRPLAISLVVPGNRKNERKSLEHSLSSGERNGNSLNHRREVVVSMSDFGCSCKRQ